jgi:hypothetical protein
MGGGPPPMAGADRSRFLNALDAMAQAALRRSREAPQPRRGPSGGTAGSGAETGIIGSDTLPG